MSTNPKHIEQTSAKTPSFKSIDREIRTLTAEMEQEKTLMPEAQGGRIARLVKIYNGIKPLLSVLTALPLIPSSWRAALVLFNSALAAVAAGVDDVTADFKAGKDL
ncbi:MAG TPA: hypothetical protein VKB93_08645 [Thermoanaerobaculia bacterium]|nr:hypothetical protein [Thermoanaerobaculia bacterium]